ncbi:hypothetical protein Ae505Ps2_6170c [Pseudonocardia sp. Ae505_Ps2]|nr:hypothetical protein Ae505Ps2_6170c [Pseudonocardia sp. Ae505_Ps2]
MLLDLHHHRRLPQLLKRDINAVTLQLILDNIPILLLSCLFGISRQKAVERVLLHLGYIHLPVPAKEFKRP